MNEFLIIIGPPVVIIGGGALLYLISCKLKVWRT